MKLNFIAILVLSIILLQDATGQIPNGGFEEWETILNYEKPTFWNTNQDSNFVRFEKDTHSIEGNYSLKIVPSSFSAWTNCLSSATTDISLPMPIGENKNLVFYAKSIPDSTNQSESVFLRVRGIFFNSGNLDSDYLWETLDKIEEFSKIQIPISNPNIDSITIQIVGGAINGPADGCLNSSFSWIDGLGIEDAGPTNTYDTIKKPEKEVNIYPNPSNGIFEIKENNFNFTKYQLFTLNGELIENGDITGSTVNIKSKINGLVLLTLIQEKGNELVKISKQILIE